MSLPPINQCNADDPFDGLEPSDDAAASPKASRLEPCFEAAPGVEGAGTECADDLLQRFSGQGGAPNADQASVERPWPCGAEAVHLVASCGGAVLSHFPAGVVGGLTGVLRDVGCAMAISDLDECIQGTDRR